MHRKKILHNFAVSNFILFILIQISIIMATSSSSKKNLSAKEIREFKAVAVAYQDSFKSASRLFLELASSNATAKKVCNYLGLSAEALKCSRIAETRKAVLAKLPCYFLRDGSEIHQPAKLVKIPSESGLSAYVAKKCSYIDALANLAMVLANGNAYDCHKVALTEVHFEDGKYVGDVHLYSKDFSPSQIAVEDYLSYLEACRIARISANEKRIAVLADLQKG